MNLKSVAFRAVLPLAVLFTLGTAPLAFAQPSNAKLVVGFTPGGPIDAVARIISTQLGHELGVNMIVENRAGANAGLAAEYVAKAEPDGRTLFLTSTGAVAISPSLYEKLSFNPVRDFEPVSLVVSTDEVFVVGAKHPANDVKEFIAYANKQNRGAAIASSGTGSIPHLAAELFADVTGIKMVHVPYKGVAPAITDVIAGHVDGIFIDIPVALAHIKAGNLKALGLAAPQRHATLPTTKTFQEVGIKGVDSSNWYAIYAPKGTPVAELDRINQAIRRTLANPTVKNAMLAIGAEPSPSTRADLGKLLKSDLDKWQRVIRDKKITAD